MTYALFYTDREQFRQLKGIVLDDTIPIVVDDISVQDIDTEEDWSTAEYKYKYLLEHTDYFK